MLTKPSTHPFSAAAVEISSPRKPWEAVKSADRGNCEYHLAKVLGIVVPITSKHTPSGLLLQKSMKQSGYSHKQSGSSKIVGSFFYMLSGNKFKLSAAARAVCVWVSFPSWTFADFFSGWGSKKSIERRGEK